MSKHLQHFVVTIGGQDVDVRAVNADNAEHVARRQHPGQTITGIDRVVRRCDCCDVALPRHERVRSGDVACCPRCAR